MSHKKVRGKLNPYSSMSQMESSASNESIQRIAGWKWKLLVIAPPASAVICYSLTFALRTNILLYCIHYPVLVVGSVICLKSTVTKPENRTWIVVSMLSLLLVIGLDLYLRWYFATFGTTG